VKPQGGARPKHVIGHYGFNRNCLIEVLNPGNKFCLFIAAELGRLRRNMLEYEARRKKKLQTPPNSMTDTTFRRIRKDANRQHNLAIELMRRCEIPMDLLSYNIEHLEIVQCFYNRVYGHQYQLCVFNDNPFTTKNIHPIWKGKCEGISRNIEIQNIYLFLEQEHFAVITCLGSFFRVPAKQYCLGIFTTILYKSYQK
jgi:hypothetical protein